MITDAFTALNHILVNNATISAMCARYTDQNGTPTEFPLIMGGILPKSQKLLPAITFRVEPSENEHFLNIDSFIVNCFTEEAREGYVLAKTIVKQLNEQNHQSDGYASTTTARILTQWVDPSSKQVNTPVEIRLINIFN